MGDQKRAYTKSVAKRQRNFSFSSETEEEDIDGDDPDLKNNATTNRRTYNYLWEKDPQFKNWLQKNRYGDERAVAFCKTCNVALRVKSGRSDLVSHSKTKKHMANIRSVQFQPSVASTFSSGAKRDVQKAELQMAAFTAEHNISFNVSEHLSRMQKNAFYDSKVASSLSCGRTKTTSLVKNVLGAHQFETICDLLRVKRFSICIDESTDLSTTKILSLVVRVNTNYNIQDYLLDLIEVKSADAISLYSAIVKVFNNQNIDYKSNLIGFAADGANNMTGKNHSVSSLLKRDCPSLIIFKCICHSFSLCSSYACLKIPSSIESMARDIYNYLGNSPKRISQFDDIVGLLGDKPKKMLHPSQTRWLSLQYVVERILEFYQPLKIYFAFVVNVDNIDSARNILTNLENPTTELYLEFLKYILSIINKLNRIFQSEKPQVHKMYQEVERLVLLVLDNFVKPEYLHQFQNIDFQDPQIIVNENAIYLGVEVQSRIDVIDLCADEKKMFKQNCISFYTELCTQIFKRFDFDENVLKYFSAIDPVRIVKREETSLNLLLQHFPRLVDKNDFQNIDSEFREVRNLNFKDLFKDSLESIDIEQFWKVIAEIKRGDKSESFPLLTKFVFEVLSFPNSSANVERIFSQINLNKTKTRNRLTISTLKGILFSKDYLKFHKCECHNLKINDTLLKKFNSNMYLE